MVVCGTSVVMIPDFLGRLIGAKPGYVMQKQVCLNVMTQLPLQQDSCKSFFCSKVSPNTVEDIEKNLASGQMQIVGWSWST